MLCEDATTTQAELEACLAYAERRSSYHVSREHEAEKIYHLSRQLSREAKEALRSNQGGAAEAYTGDGDGCSQMLPDVGVWKVVSEFIWQISNLGGLHAQREQFHHSEQNRPRIRCFPIWRHLADSLCTWKVNQEVITTSTC